MPTLDDDSRRLAVKVSRAAELLDCSRQHVYDMLARNELRSVSCGGRSRRIPMVELERLVGGVPDAGAA